MWTELSYPSSAARGVSTPMRADAPSEDHPPPLTKVSSTSCADARGDVTHSVTITAAQLAI